MADGRYTHYTQLTLFTLQEREHEQEQGIEKTQDTL